MITHIEEHPLVRRLLGLSILTIGVACLALVVSSFVRDSSLWFFGRKVSASVVESWAEQTSEEGASEVTFDYYVRYQFETERGQVITAVSRVAAGEWVGVGYGQQAGIRHDVMDDRAQPAAAPVFQEQKHISEDVAGGLTEGATIDIVYFPPYPAHNRLDESRFISILACAYLPFIIVGIIATVVGWRLVRRGGQVGGD
ncbi:MAG: hypothetical protein PVF77_01275 [Anaerolineae bacterium]